MNTGPALGSIGNVKQGSIMRRDIDHQELLRIDGELEKLSRDLVCSSDDADDARQDAWLSATEGAAARTPSLLGWLSRAIRFRGMRKRRDELRRREFEPRAARQRAPESAEDILERSEVRMRLIRAVSSLKPAYRQTITLTFFEGLSSQEVARVMDVPVETVRTRNRRGLEQLRRQLDAEYGSRETWALALVPAAILAETAAASAAATELVKGMAIMSGKVKAAIAVGFVLVVAATLYQFTQESSEYDLDSSHQSAAVENKEARLPRRSPEEGDDTPEQAPPPQETKLEQTPDIEAEVPRNQYGEEVGRLELSVTYGKNGEPARDIPVTFLPFSVTDPFFRRETFRTDESGSLTLEAYPAGRALVTTRVGGVERISIKAGATTRHTLVVPLMSHIYGKVLTPDGKAVVGAQIVSGEFGHPVHSEPITVTGADGRFEIPNFGHNGIGVLGARAKGRLPSAMVMVFPSKGDKKELNLVLGGPAARAIITVENQDGEAIAGARCIAGKSDHKQFSLPDGNKGMTLSRTDDTTDENGQLVLDGLAPGELAFTLRAYDYAAHQGSLLVMEGQTTRHRVVLQEGGIVKGIVTDKDGLPLEKAQVHVGQYGTIDSHFQYTNKKGEFQFNNVALGQARVSAEKKNFGLSNGTVVVTATEPAIWNVQLKQPQAFVQGIVLDDGGNPVSNMSVSVSVVTSNRYIGGFDRTDKNGRFKVDGLESEFSGFYSLQVRSPKNNITLVSMSDIKAGPDMVTVTIPADAVGVATIIGRIVGRDGKPVGGATISALRQPFVSGGSTGIKTADGDGRFEFEDISPGSYRFSIRAASYGYQKSEVKTVANGQTLDVGDIALVEPGQIKITSPGLAPGESTSVYARSLDGGSSVSIEIEGPTTLSQPLSPGLYRLKIGDKNMSTRTADVTVLSGQIVEANLPVSQGKAMKFSFARDLKDGSIESCTFRLLDAKGEIVARGTHKKYRQNTLYLTFTLGKGNHTLEVEDNEGRKARVLLTAESEAEQVLRLD